MTQILIIRHGFSCGNKEKRFSGQANVELDCIGHKQAREIAEYIVNCYKIDMIYSSDLKRAYDTVKPLSEATGIPINALKELREVDVGEWQGMYIDDVKEKYPESFELYRKKPGLAHFDGGESYAELLARVAPAIDEIASANDGKTVVICTHGGVIRVLRSLWEGIPLDRIEEIKHVPNASITVVEYNDGDMMLKRVGMCEHLGDKTTEEGIK